MKDMNMKNPSLSTFKVYFKLETNSGDDFDYDGFQYSYEPGAEESKDSILAIEIKTMNMFCDDQGIGWKFIS